MTGLYVDTSALARLIQREPDAAVIQRCMSEYDQLWSSELLAVELRRFGMRHRMLRDAEDLLESVRLLPISSGALLRASCVKPAVVRTLDAIHLDAALVLREEHEIAAVLTFDRQLGRGCGHHELAVEAPLAA
ncbi:PIN domain-containing protein [Conexibacter sp. JD483]|uniref:PIN domain-containing protein n=1 Tax=unclassified Conexibacter TaxID=2627773 RepID=UPI00272308FC|nr:MULTISPECIES: PIN domain-containing protein [unclassified Conexibacter]MDO8185285.1 PIN domain-containing protein [Conexibacter sp. CPCC 205706]MDO8198331.1 PIN domain-containing protein [Conexibacter sp. CPCC 205762]MDR9370518.1 PIN domain-containing protein [Conexibacter sp. JD483]